MVRFEPVARVGTLETVCTHARDDERQRQAEIFVPLYRGTNRPMALMTQMPNLRIVQITAAGTDEWASEVPDGVVLAGARGAHAGPVSEWVLSAALAQYRQWPALVRFQDEHTCAHRKFAADTLHSKRALIIGAGSIGSAVARLLTAFGTESTLVAGTESTPLRRFRSSSKDTTSW